MRIPDYTIEEILRRTDIVEVVGEVVNLRRRGANYIGLCPFHNEKTPSFNVLPERGIFKCFGCGKGGNAAIFLRDYHKLSYPDALRDLAKRAGVALPEEQDDRSREEITRYEAAYNVLRTAGNFYYRQLLEPSGEQALSYLQRRGFSDETIKMFGLGFSPDSFAATGAELKAQGFNEEALLDAGLSIKRDEDGKVWDRFRGRLMFPIQNATGRVIGFGARRMNDADTSGANAAKYVNSPQSLVYDKSKVLYGIFQAKDTLRRLQYGILVEGYADLLSVFQAGFKNVVASSGTALTREQLKLLGGYCKRLKIVYDADAAGINAALRGLDLAIEEGFDVEIVRLPAGDDPDSLIQRDGAEAFEKLLAGALSLVNFKCETLQAQGAMDSPSAMADAVRSVVETISKCPDTLKRDFMIRDVAMRFSLPEQDLYRELGVFLRKRQFDRIQEAGREAAREAARTQHHTEPSQSSSVPTETQAQQGDAASEETTSGKAANEKIEVVGKIGTVAGKFGDLLPAERELLRVALTHEGAVGYIRQRLEITEEQFVSSAGKRLFTLVSGAAPRSRLPIEWLMANTEAAELSDDDIGLIAALAVREETPSERWKIFEVELHEDFATLLRDCALRLVLERHEAELRHLHHALKHAADHNEGAERELELLRSLQHIDDERRRLLLLIASAVEA